MNKIKFIWIVFFGSILFFCCEKKELEPSRSDEAAALYVQGQLAGMDYRMAAGEDSVIGETDQVDELIFNDTIRSWAFSLITRINDTISYPACQVFFSHPTFAGDSLLTSLRRELQVGTYGFTLVLPFQEPVISLQVVDKMGEFYSLDPFQPPESFFEITAVEERVVDGKTFIQATIRFQVELLNFFGNQRMTFTNGEGVIVWGGI